MAQTSARGVALAALGTWRTKKQFADAIIAEALSKSALQSPDRAFALELFYGRGELPTASAEEGIKTEGRECAVN